MFSLADINVDSKVSLILDVSLQVGHFEVVINPIHYEVGEPGVLSFIFE